VPKSGGRPRPRTPDPPVGVRSTSSAAAGPAPRHLIWRLMSVLEFIASLVQSLAWPLATVVAVFWLRKPITSALEKRLRRAKLGSAEFEFDPAKTEELRAEVEGERAELERSAPPIEKEATQESADDEAGRMTKLVALAELSPVGAFLTSFIELERTLRDLLADRDDVLRAPPVQLGRAAVLHDLFSESDYSAFEYLRRARNELVHATREDLTPAQAVELATLASSLARTALVRAFIQMRVEGSTGDVEAVSGTGGSDHGSSPGLKTSGQYRDRSAAPPPEE
jgi:hypothetical protein